MTSREALRARPPLWRTILAACLCAFASFLTAAFSELGHRGNGGFAALLLLVSVLLAVSLGWRHRARFVLVLVASAVAVILPVGTSVALVVLVSLITHERGARVWWATGAASAATAVTFTRDMLAPTPETSLLKTFFGPADAATDVPVDLNWWVLPLTVIVAVGVAVAVGLMRRSRRSLGVASQRVRAAEGRAVVLHDELARQQERERIAREVHDVLGHQLSLLSLHAGALEVNAADDEQLAQSARQVRASAAQSVADLQSLLRVLRENPDDTSATLTPRLADLAALIHETIEAGVVVASNVYVNQGDDADPALARAVYRVVQELLTNARKHAPAAPVRLSVTGGAPETITIEASNPYDAQRSGATPGTGMGLEGIAERVASLEGTIRYGLDESGTVFQVRVSLPWRSRAQSEGVQSEGVRGDGSG